MIPYKSPLLTVAPTTLEKRLEIMNAARALVLQEDVQLRERRAAIAALRRDFDGLLRDCRALARALQHACHEWTRAELQARLRKYSADQPRVPAGNSNGGQWTSDDGGDTKDDPPSDTSATPDHRLDRVRNTRLWTLVSRAMLRRNPPFRSPQVQAAQATR